MLSVSYNVKKKSQRNEKRKKKTQMNNPERSTYIELQKE